MPTLRAFRHPARACGVALAVAVGLLLAAASAAHAGTYVVHSCQTPTGGAAGYDGWRFTTNDARLVKFSDFCPRSGLFMWAQADRAHPATDEGRLQFQSPPWTKIARYRIWRHVAVASAQNYFFSPIETVWGQSDETRVLTACGGTGAARSCTTLGDRNNPASDANLVDRTPPAPLYRYGLYISCGTYGDNAPDCGSGPAPRAETVVWRAQTTLSDDTAPAFPTEPTGGLRAGGTLSGPQQLSAIVTDLGGGVHSTSLEIDGRVVAQQNTADGHAECREPYTKAVPCPSSASATFTVDTAALPDGAHQLRVIGTDVAGNATAWGPVTFTTDNSQAFCTPGAIGGPGQPRLEVGVARVPGRGRPAPAAKRSVTVAMGRQATFGARLTDANGAPIAGASVCVVTRPADDAPMTILARVATDADGRVGVTIPAGTSRQVWAVYRGAGAISAKATVRVRSRVSLRPNRARLRAGGRITMKGVVRGQPIPREGVLVNIQAKNGRRWQTFRQVRARGKGSFTVRYRFRGGGRYQLRAAIPAQGAYHYAPSSSRPFRVRVGG